MIRRSVISGVLAFLILIGSIFGGLNSAALAETVQLTNEQRNAIAMLNHITVLTQDINASKNSRLYMEEAYSELINNTYPSAVDTQTLRQLTGLLDTMENYRMIAVKRDRLEFIYEQNQAQAIRSAIPNPLGLISAVQSGSKAKLAMSIVYMAVDSITSYTTYTREADLQYIQDGWALDDEEAKALHERHKDTFSYMVKTVRGYGLPDDFTLTENAVEEFVKWKTNDNYVRRIQFLESNKTQYQAYGGYWLLLAESYYQYGDYAKCLEAINEYEALGTRIFRKDYELAKVLPLVISAADEQYDDTEYAETADKYAQMILDNTDHDDWALRYFAAQTYVDLYGKTKDRKFAEVAYGIVLDNVNYLVDEQQMLNEAYLAPVVETPTPKDATTKEKDQIANYNKLLKEKRKSELPPVYEPLRLNCDLLFALVNELDIAGTEQKKIDGMLHPSGHPLFLTTALDSLYYVNPLQTEQGTETVDFAGTAVKIPCSFLADGATVIVSIKESDAAEAEVYTDWELKSVNRSSEGNVSNYVAIYESSEARKHAWKPDGEIVVTINPKEGSNAEPVEVRFISVSMRNNWYDYLKVWEGQNNEWYDYLKVWDAKVRFERVE